VYYLLTPLYSRLKDAWYNWEWVISLYKCMVILGGEAVVFEPILSFSLATQIGRKSAENRQVRYDRRWTGSHEE
jgi:hypothetical protein